MVEMEIVEEEEYIEEDEGEVSEVSYTVNDHVTLHQPELCAIYTAIHWAWKTDGNPWDDVDIKQIVGHAILRLDEDDYRRLDLRDVIGCLHREDSDLTRAVKPIVERLKGNFVPWIAQLRERYLDMCGGDGRLTEQRDNECRAREAAQRADTETRPGKRRRTEEPENYASRNAVSAGPSGGGRGGRGADKSARPMICYPSIDEVLAGSSTEIQDGRDAEGSK